MKALLSVVKVLGWHQLSLFPMAVSTKNGWYVVLMEYGYVTAYHKGSASSNADVLSRVTASASAATLSLPQYSYKNLHDSQLQDATLSTVFQARLASADSPQGTTTLAPTESNRWCTLLSIFTLSYAADSHGNPSTSKPPERHPQS